VWGGVVWLGEGGRREVKENDLFKKGFIKYPKNV